MMLSLSNYRNFLIAKGGGILIARVWVEGSNLEI